MMVEETRTIDAQIAEKIIGLRLCPAPSQTDGFTAEEIAGPWCDAGESIPALMPVKPYSSSRIAALDVEEALSRMGFIVQVTTCPGLPWASCEVRGDAQTMGKTWFVKADSTPLAVCLAALKVIDAKVKTDALGKGAWHELETLREQMTALTAACAKVLPVAAKWYKQLTEREASEIPEFKDATEVLAKARRRSPA